MSLRRAGGGSAHMTTANKGAEDLRMHQHQLQEDGAHRLPPSPMATTSTLHLLTSRNKRVSTGSVTTGEERDRVDTAILFSYGEGERARREKPYQTRGYIYNGVKNLSISVVLNRIRAFLEKRNENWWTIFLTYQERKLDQKHAPNSRSRESSRTHK